MVVCLGMGWGGVDWGWAKSPGHPEGSPHPLPPIWPPSDHQALTTQGVCPYYLPALTSGRHRGFSLQSSRWGRLCVRMRVYTCAPVTRSVFLSVTECTVGHIYVSWAVCVGLGGVGSLRGDVGLCVCLPVCLLYVAEWAFLCDHERLCQPSLTHRLPGSSLSTLSPPHQEPQG
ncbi:hypothetical protein HJG60_008740 [Phyllostomus discolor]|uniref:Uncharacterized protein n=1 Tax=Phyllostomus discolor TaxID=89673 RepID=A0A833YT96_9CHIR|nr:hypothetical protein HJG60_008740 [Phyllostomus discolor]